jgi:hypothetical protein
MDKNIADYVRSCCDLCQRFKAVNSKVGELHPIAQTVMGEVWAADLAILPKT